MDASGFRADEWNYLGEGNRNLVVAHHEGKVVLKFLKFPVNSAHGNKMLGALPAVLDSTIVYTGSIMAPMLGKNFVHSGEVVTVPRSFARNLVVQIQSSRPESRHDSCLDVWSGLAVRLPNLTRLPSGATPLPLPSTGSTGTLGSTELMEPSSETRGQQLPTSLPPTEIPTFCIEIKPKCGFLPGAASVVNPLKRRICRYCMQQYLKVANGKCRKVSDYCPLDLYSGNRSRMAFAIRSLIKNSQNNFRIFKNGTLIFGCRDEQECPCDVGVLANHLSPLFPPPASGTVHDRWPHTGAERQQAETERIIGAVVALITHALLSPLGGPGGVDVGVGGAGEPPPTCQASLYARGVGWCANGMQSAAALLPQESVLARILAVQRLDLLDIEGIMPLYQRVRAHMRSAGRFSAQLDEPLEAAFRAGLGDRSTRDDGSLAFAITKIRQYLVSMTAKDVSVMIALAPSGLAHGPPAEALGESTYTYMSAGSTPVRFSVSVLDLDPKPMDKIPHHHQQHRLILRSYLMAHVGLAPTDVASRVPASHIAVLPGHLSAETAEEEEEEARGLPDSETSPSLSWTAPVVPPQSPAPLGRSGALALCATLRS